VQTWDAIRARRNVRTYTDEPIEPAQLDQILEAGRRTPSARNWQPWDFVVVTEGEALQELSKVWMGAGHIAGSAATIALIAPVAESERDKSIAQYDLGQATMSIMIEAADLGIGSGHSAVGDQDLARQLLGFPPDRFCAYLIALGHPAERPLAPLTKINRKPFDEVVHRGHW
jgi:nitroreductase